MAGMPVFADQGDGGGGAMRGFDGILFDPSDMSWLNCMPGNF